MEALQSPRLAVQLVASFLLQKAPMHGSQGHLVRVCKDKQEEGQPPLLVIDFLSEPEFLGLCALFVAFVFYI
jgi:hypothetical protein